MGTTDPTEYVYNATTALLTKVRYTSGQNTYEASCEYDAARRLTKLSDWMNGGDYLLYAYDNADRLTKITDYDDTTLDYTYDYAGNVVTMDDYAGNVVTYTYTDRNQVSTITAPGSKTWTFYYDALGQLNQYYLPNAMNTFYQFDTRNRLTKIWHLDGFTSLDTFTYALDNMSNITKTTNLDGGYWKYWYDLRYQLTKAERYNSADTLLKKFTYTYNTAGNMRTKVVDDSTTYVYAYNKANELTKQTLSGTDTAFAYDAWGRMTSKTQGFYSAAYAYNYHDKLTGVTSNFPNEGNVTYEYGGDGKRHKRQDSSTTTLYNWDAGWNVISEEDNCGTLSKTYVHDPGKAIGTILADVSGTDANGTWRHYFQDNIGSTRRLRDSSKGSLAYYEYEPYGGEYTKYGTDSTRYKFTGKEWDATAQLDYFPFRYYSPSVARWMTRDPLGLSQGPNLYAYVYSNPARYVDPLGLGPWAWIITGEWNPDPDVFNAANEAFFEWSLREECEDFNNCWSRCMSQSEIRGLGFGLTTIIAVGVSGAEMYGYVSSMSMAANGYNSALDVVYAANTGVYDVASVSQAIVEANYAASMAHYGSMADAMATSIGHGLAAAFAFDAARAATCWHRCKR